MIKVITYTDHRMTISAELCRSSALKHGAAEARIFTPAQLPADFVSNHSATLSADKGAGYYLWKPKIINDTLQGMKDGETLIYADCGVEFINNLHYLESAIDESDVLLFANMWDHYHWCKTKVLDAMLPGWRERKSPKQVQASVVVLRGSDKSRAFVSEWLEWSEKPGMIDDSDGGSHDQFAEHRWDQAILTNVALNNNIDLNWWAASYSNGAFIYQQDHYKIKYPVMFNHHRLRDSERK